MGHQPCFFPAKTSADFRKGSHQPLYIPFPVSHGNIGQDIAQIPKFDLNVIFLSQQVIHFNTRQTDIQGVDRQFRIIKPINGASIDQFLSIGIISANLVDFLSGISCKFLHLSKNFLSMKGQILSGQIQTG